MKTQHIQIGMIPAILYGEPAQRGYLFLHGQMGHKEEAAAFALIACPQGYQVLSIDLPGHGERQNRDEVFTPWTAVPDIQAAAVLVKAALENGLSPCQQHRSLFCYAGLGHTPSRSTCLPYCGHGTLDFDYDGLGRSVGGTTKGAG